MDIKFVDLGQQYDALKEEIDEAIAGVLARTDFVLGADVARLEEEFAAYCKAAYAIGVDNGTSALEMALRALEIGPGDEVLVPANSFIASASAVSFTGATPVFVDVDPDTYNISVEEAERAITPATRAIMPVHLYGQPAEMGAIMALAAAHDLLVVEDACQAHGARYEGQRVGAIGHVGAFSFYPGKNLGAYGDGGAVVTNDPAVAERIRIMRNCGQKEKYHHVTLSWNRRLDTMQAAILRVKLRYLDQWNELRRERAGWYDEALAGSNVVTPYRAPGREHVYHLYVIRTGERAGLQAHLAAQGIATGVHYPTPIHLQPAYTHLGYEAGAFPVAEQQAAQLLSLPMFPELTALDVQRVVEAIHDFQMTAPGRAADVAA